MLSVSLFSAIVFHGSLGDLRYQDWSEGPASAADNSNIKDWTKWGREELKMAMEMKENTNIAKNVIMFVGEGLDLATVSAARRLKGQHYLNKLRMRDSISAVLVWDRFPNFAVSKVQAFTEIKVPDAAATASAMFTGARAPSGKLQKDTSKDTADTNTAVALSTVLDWAQSAGKRTGFVTNQRVTNAVLAALYAKTPNMRERDAQLNTKGVKDTARQMVEDSPGVTTDLILGGGLAQFWPSSVENNFSRFAYKEKELISFRADGLHLVEQWKESNPDGRFISNRSQLLKPTLMNASKILGLFALSDMPHKNDHPKNMESPSLEEMTLQGITFLQNKPGDEGYFLIVQGGNPGNDPDDLQANQLVEETLVLDSTVMAALELVDIGDTLIIITSTQQDSTNQLEDYNGNTNMSGLIDKKRGDSGVEKNSIKTNSLDLGIWSIGPMSHLLFGVREPTYIAHVVSYAACFGPQAEYERCAKIQHEKEQRNKRETSNRYTIGNCSVVGNVKIGDCPKGGSYREGLSSILLLSSFLLYL